jgi:hypothetical protein
MGRHDKAIAGYEHQRIKLRARITSIKRRGLTARMKMLGTDTAAIIRRTERQIADLERAIAKCQEKDQHPS